MSLTSSAVNKRRCSVEDKVEPQPSRKSPRLQEIRDLTPPGLIQIPKRVRPISTSWFLKDWLDTALNKNLAAECCQETNPIWAV